MQKSIETLCRRRHVKYVISVIGSKTSCRRCVFDKEEGCPACYLCEFGTGILTDNGWSNHLGGHFEYDNDMDDDTLEFDSKDYVQHFDPSC